MDDGVINLSGEQLEDLADKLDAFGEVLSTEQRRVLATLLSGGIAGAMDPAGDDGDEVSGFGLFPGSGGVSPGTPPPGFAVRVPAPASFGLLGDSLRLGQAGRLGSIYDKTASQ